MIKKISLICVLLISVLVSAVAGDKYLKVKRKETDRGYVFLANNGHVIPYTVTIDFPDRENMKCNLSLPYTVVIPPKAKGFEILELYRVNKNKRYGYSITVATVMGDVEKTSHIDNFPYTVPFEHGTKHILGQGFHGKFTHTDETNAYAVDFNMDIGTPICAARDGVVVEVKEDSNLGGPGEEYGKHANFVTIYHKEDGSFASYVHLKHEGAIVKVGNKVKAGQVIGYSGNTGRSSGPHLHFSISIPLKNGRFRSVPFVFLTKDGKTVAPKEGKAYYSYHKGGKEFKAVSADSISNDTYKTYRKKIKETNTVKIREKHIDNIVVIFIRNGYNRKLQVRVTMELQNLKPSKSIPRSIKISELTERFLLILRPIDPGKPTSYGIGYEVIPID